MFIKLNRIFLFLSFTSLITNSVWGNTNDCAENSVKYAERIYSNPKNSDLKLAPEFLLNTPHCIQTDYRRMMVNHCYLEVLTLNQEIKKLSVYLDLDCTPFISIIHQGE